MTTNNNAFRTFNRWLIFAGLMLFAAYWVSDYGLFDTLLEQDASRLSIVILIFFVLFSTHAGWIAFRLGKQTQCAATLTAEARDKHPMFGEDESGLRIGSASINSSLAHEHLGFLAEKFRSYGQIADQDLLLDRLDNRLRSGHETGWFIADLMIRLGLLGTVIGFIFMLSSISTVTTVDLQAIQQLLSNMSGGMRVALYTTLAGLSAGILLSFQYQLLEQGADRLLADIIELSEVHAIPQLRRFAEGASE